MNIKMLKAAAAGLILSTSTFANAGLIAFTDEASWLAAVSSVEGTIDFNDIISDTIINEATYEYDFFNISESGAGSLRLDTMPGSSNSGNGIDNTTFLSMEGGQSGSSNMSITFDISLEALAFDTYNYDCGNDNSNIAINGVSLGATPTSGGCPSGTSGFFGVIATGGSVISSVNFLPVRTSGTYNGFDNFQYSTSIPEPTTVAIFGLALMGLAARRFKR
jgi:hypothetical protein